MIFLNPAKLADMTEKSNYFGRYLQILATIQEENMSAEVRIKTSTVRIAFKLSKNLSKVGQDTVLYHRVLRCYGPLEGNPHEVMHLSICNINI